MIVQRILIVLIAAYVTLVSQVEGVEGSFQRNAVLVHVAAVAALTGRDARLTRGASHMGQVDARWEGGSWRTDG